MTRAIIVFMTGIFTAGLLEARPEIHFEREIEVSDRHELTWDDLASVQEGTPGIFERLRSLKWNPRSSPRENLRQWKREGSEVSFVVPAEVKILKTKGFSLQEFRRKLVNRLRSQCASCRFELQSVQGASSRVGPNWALDESSVKLSGQILVGVSDDKSSGWIPVRMKITRKALVLKRSILMGAKIQAADVETRDVEVSHQRETPLEPDDLNGIEAARGLSAGQALFPSDVRQEELVRRGQNVKIYSGNEYFEVSVTGSAEQSGRKGDLIRVKNPGSGKTVMGLVVGSGEVKLQ